ncbi:MAG: hypothetical protein WA996_10415 [Candidatus Promineifilaceae bacterium]
MLKNYALHSDALHSDTLHSDTLHSDTLHSDGLRSDEPTHRCASGQSPVESIEPSSIKAAFR